MGFMLRLYPEDSCVFDYISNEYFVWEILFSSNHTVVYHLLSEWHICWEKTYFSAEPALKLQIWISLSKVPIMPIQKARLPETVASSTECDPPGPAHVAFPFISIRPGTRSGLDGSHDQGQSCLPGLSKLQLRLIFHM